jgi:Universal stress protein family
MAPLPMINSSLMANASGPILAVIDCVADDVDVVAEAVWLARAARTEVVLVHVARPVTAWAGSFERAFQQVGLEQRALSEMAGLAEQVRAADIQVRVDDVYFGDASSEVAYAANRRRASAVVAARRATRLSGLLAWRSRDARLGRLLDVPLVLIEPGSAERRALEALPDFELVPDERLVAPRTAAPSEHAAEAAPVVAVTPSRRLTRVA